MHERVYTYLDLEDSGALIMALFAYAYPDGLTLAQMDADEHGWVHRVAQRIREREVVHGDGN